MKKGSIQTQDTWNKKTQPQSIELQNPTDLTPPLNALSPTMVVEAEVEEVEEEGVGNPWDGVLFPHLNNK